ncbi:acyltransferase family protein [Clostridium sp.]|uniref:acyltransferase family protein n=1 Tax=Clostridium sp. TaxID=1506 RepID=UPI002848BE37|nr:acyltransferase family protein [Clostridium sp.]MDR3594806.1 acyltransferase family protein [Clostridium sp.]
MINEKQSKIINIMKGIGILMVMLGHRSLPNIIVKYIYVFHMPLFFVISGYLFDVRRYNDNRSFIIKKGRSLLQPYCCFWIISLIVQALASNANILPKIEYGQLINSFFYITQKGIWNGPLWFLVCLFVVEIIYFLLVKRFGNDYLKLYIMIFFIIGLLLSKVNLVLPFKIDVAFTGLVFFTLGNMVREYGLSVRTNKKQDMIIFCITTVIVFMTAIFFNPVIVSMMVCQYGNYIIFIITSIIGVISIYYIAKIIREFKLLEFIGSNSLVIMSLHFIIYLVILDPIQYNIINININNFFIRNILTIVNVVMCLMILKPIIEFINCKVSFIIGKKKNTSFNFK